MCIALVYDVRIRKTSKAQRWATVLIENKDTSKKTRDLKYTHAYLLAVGAHTSDSFRLFFSFFFYTYSFVVSIHTLTRGVYPCICVGFPFHSSRIMGQFKCRRTHTSEHVCLLLARSLSRARTFQSCWWCERAPNGTKRWKNVKMNKRINVKHKRVGFILCVVYARQDVDCVDANEESSSHSHQRNAFDKIYHDMQKRRAHDKN